MVDRPKREYLIDTILPAGEFHIIAGPSGAGKTREIIQMLVAWSRGEAIFGHRSYPAPFVYACRDRGILDIQETLRGVGVDPDSFPYLSLLDTDRYKLVRDNVEGFVRALVTEMLEVKLIVIDGLAMMAPPKFRSIDYQSVASFACAISRLCHELGVTIIAIMHSPKCKEGERYLNPRQRVSGSVSWGAVGNTIMLVEPKEGSKDSRRRVLTILPRNAAEEEHELRFNDEGRLVDATDDPEAPEVRAADAELRGSGKLNRWYDSLEPGKTFTTDDLGEVCIALSVSMRTAFRWLTDKVVACLIEKLAHGVYRKPLPQ